MTLEETQIAKIDLVLDKLGLDPGMKVLDVGCGWGSTMKRAVETYDVNVVGLTLSRNQAAYVEQLLAGRCDARSARVELRGWEEFDEPVDRIVSIAACEHFGHDRYDDFFAMAYRVLPADGVMLLHTITRAGPEERQQLQLPVTMSLLRFTKFLLTEIFPAAGCHWCRRLWLTPGRRVLSLGGSSPLGRTMREHLTSGPTRWKPTTKRPSRSNRRRSTNGI
jgi:cyclopropane-fatty-acyl-phospholipid synthase